MTVERLVYQIYFDNGTSVVPVSPTQELPVTLDGEELTLSSANITSLLARSWTLASGTDSVTAVQGTSPWVVSGTVTSTPSGTQDVNITGSVTLPVTVGNFPASYPLPAAQVTSLKTVSVDNFAVKTLTYRMKNFDSADGYNIWLDTDDVSYIYILEAPEAATSGDTGFRGIRVDKSLTGLVGKVETNTAGTLTFDNRTTDTGWA